jgi:hypothetical protein
MATRDTPYRRTLIVDPAEIPIPVSSWMVSATLNTTGEDRIEDSAPFSAAVVHIMDEVYGCSLPASPKKNRM